jgi:hypothetical protein
MKKVLSLVLVIALVLSSFSFAFAANFEDVEGDYENAINTLVALGVVTGYEDGTFKPERVVTRAEMAKLIVEILGYGDLVAGSKSNFADTQGHWADPWIALAAGRGLVIGTGDGKFTPDRTVSYDEAITMIVRALGYSDNSNELAGMTWPTNFKVKAAELGLTKNVALNAAGADRGGVAQLLYNALEAELVTVNTDGDIVPSEKELLSRLAELDENYNVTPEKIDPDNKNYAGNLVDLAPYMFQNLKVYLNDDDEVVYVKGSNSLVVEGEFDDVNGSVLTIEESNGKTKNVDFDDSDLLLATPANRVKASFIYRNGSINESDVDLDDFDDFETIKVVVNDGKTIGGNGNGKIDSNEIIGVVVTERTKLVRIEKVYVDGKDSINGIDLPVDSDGEVDLAKITVKGDAEELEDIEVDDIVVAYASEDETAITLVVTRNSVEGRVTKVTDADTVSVNGTSYDLASKNLVGDGVLDLGDEGVFYLDQFGDIADYDGEGVGPSDYAVVLAAADGDVAKRFGLSVDTYPEVKLATQDGEEIVYELDIKLKSTGVVDSSVEITPITGAAYDLFTGTYNDTDRKELDVDIAFADDNNYLIKYSLNSAGRIDEIEIVANVTDYALGAGANNVDQDKDEIAEGVIIFNAGDDFDVVDLDALNTKFKAYVVENKSGDIEVLVVNKDEVEKATTVIFAYLNKVTQTYNANDKRVNAYTVYVDGEKKEIEADDYKKLSVDTYNYVISFDYTGDVIDDSDVKTDLTGVPATATAITANRGRIQLDVGGSVTFDTDSDESIVAEDETFVDGWYTLSEHATVVIVDPTTTVPNGVDKIADLYDIDKGDTLEVFFNADGEIDLIVIGR